MEQFHAFINKRKVLIRSHFGYPVFVEEKPLQLARISITGDKLQDSVILHPRYVPSSVEHELISVYGYRRGRTVDILLEEPLEIEGKQYGVLNFKGVGADADADMQIHPTLWWHNYSFVPPFDIFGRTWGAVTTEEAQSEFVDQKSVVEQAGIVCNPHIIANEVPSSVCDMVQKFYYYRRADFFLSQLVRAQQTNIRSGDIEDLESSQINFDIFHQNKNLGCYETLATIDACAINSFQSLLKEGKSIYSDGLVADNRFLNGIFTDQENYKIRSIKDIDFALRFVTSLVYTTPSRLLFSSASQIDYLRVLEEKTNLPFSVLHSVYTRDNIFQLFEQKLRQFVPC